ncbi:MAG: HD-GYP domain-containing protein [Armatimonadota bacterium]
MGTRDRALARALNNVLDPAHRPGLEATEHFMSWLRFGISAFAAAVYLLPLNGTAPVRGPWHLLVGAAFLYAVPHVFMGAGRPTRRSRLRVLVNTLMDFVFVSAAVYVTGGENSGFIWLFPLTIVANVLRYGDVAGALTVGGSMIAFGTIVLWQGADPRTLVPSLVARLGSFWVLYFMVAYLSRHANRMERVARQGTRLMEAVGRIGVPVNVPGNIMLALEAVCEEIKVLFDADHVLIWLVRDNELVGAAATGPRRKEFLAQHRSLDDPNLLSARVVREGRPLYVNNARSRGAGLDAELVEAFEVQAIAGIPLIHGEAAVGAMMLADSRRVQRFRDEDLAPAMLLGNLAATALYHASMHDQLRQAYTRSLQTLGEAIDVRDAYTGGHSQRIARYAEAIAGAMGCSAEVLSHIGTAAMLHDIGKIGIPDSILLKPGRLQEREMEIMKSHSLIGARLLRTAGFHDEVVSIVRHLHERFDGQGYPGGLKGEQVPLGSRILAVADTYEAMTSDRIYRAALAADDAIAELKLYTGVQFDPTVVEAFVSIHDTLAPAEEPAGDAPGVANPTAVFGSVAGYLLTRFGEFAGSQVVGTIVERLAVKARNHSWVVGMQDGKLQVQTAERQTGLEARRQILTWLLEGIEDLGGRRIAFHLLTEAVEHLSPSAREVYRVLLSPGPTEEAVRSL